MGFDQGLSGLSSSSQSLNVIGNNIANASTVGFKSSTAQFADVYAASVYGVSNLSAGLGSKVAAVAQSFTQGGISVTNNPLDLAIGGNGFFQMSQNGVTTYTRNGQFQMDQKGYIVDSSGRNLTGNLAVGGLVTGGTPVNLMVTNKELPPTMTSGAAVIANLDSTSTPPNNAALGAPTGNTQISPADPTSYNYSTPVTVYDPSGAPQSLTLYFQKVSTGQWNVAGYIGGSQVLPTSAGNNTATISFDTNGAVTAFNDTAGANAAALAAAKSTVVVTDKVSGAQAQAVISTAATLVVAKATLGLAITDGVNLATAQADVATAQDAYDSAVKAATATAGAAKAGDITALGAAATTAMGTITTLDTTTLVPPGTMSPFSLDLTQLSQYAGTSGVSSTTQNGYAKGSFSSLSVSSTGMVTGAYTNGQTLTLGQVLLTNFFNPNGLLALGDNQWAATQAAGAPNTGAPGSSVLGSLKSGAVESSNVDLTTQMVDLIVAQRMYQANAQTIKAQDTIMQTVVNL